MGLKGFSSFVQRHSDQLTKPYHLHDTKLIIDGTNLAYKLYNISSQSENDHIFGGDYETYGQLVRQFFLTLKSCHVEVIVVFDGGYDRSSKKLKTSLSRIYERFQACRATSKGDFQYQMPCLALITFRIVIQQMKITCLQSFHEADRDIAIIANRLNAPVATNDSDFFIFNLKAGQISFDTLDMSSVRRHNQHGFNYIDCRIYHVENLEEVFPNLNRDLLPIFSGYVGNDLVTQGVFQNIFSTLPKVYEKKECKLLGIHKKHHDIVKLLGWMCGKTKHEVVTTLIQSLKSDQRSAAIRLSRISEEFYSSISAGKSFLLQYLPDYDGQPIEKPSELAQFSDAFIELHCLGKVDNFLMTVMSSKLSILQPVIEAFDYPSVYLTSRNLQLTLYRLCNLMDKKVEIDVYERKDSNYAKSKLKVGPMPAEYKDHFNMPDEMKTNLLLKEIGSSLEEFKAFNQRYTFDGVEIGKKGNFALLILLVRHWIECSSTVSLENVLAILTSFIFLQVLTLPLKVLGNEEIRKEMKTRFVKYVKQPELTNSKKYNVKNVHHYNELQVFILFITRIHQLLNLKMDLIEIHKFFSSSLYYNLCVDFITRPQPMLFASILLGRSSIVDSWFKEIYEFCSNGKTLSRFRNSTAKKRKRLDSIEYMDADLRMEMIEKQFNDLSNLV